MTGRLDLAGRFEELRRRPSLLVAIAVGIVAVLLAGRHMLSSTPTAGSLVRDVNAAYRAIPGYASSIAIHADGVNGASTSTRVTRIENGLVTGFSEEITLGNSTMTGIATAAGIWLTYPGRPCWSPPDPRQSKSFHFGEPMIPTRNVRYGGPTRSGGKWKLTVIDESTPQARRHYFIDRDTKLVRSITTETGGPAAASTREVLTALHEAPEVTPPANVCAGPVGR